MRKTPILHPFLFAIHPILFLLSQNLEEVSPSEALKPMVIALAIALIGLLIFRLLLKNAYKAALLVTIAVLMFFLYSPMYIYVFRGLTLGGFVIGRHRVLFVLWGLAFAICIYLIARIRAQLTGATAYLNAFGIILVSLVLFNIVAYKAQGTEVTKANCTWQDIVSKEQKNAKTWKHTEKPLRDVYYIILDQYAREDTLSKFFEYDNSAFLNSLKDKGFYVANGSQSRYRSTYTSLSSSLNYDYLDNVAKTMGVASVGNSLCGEMIRENKTCHLLKDNGYVFIFFPTPWQVTGRNPNADIVMSSEKFRLSEFDREILYSSPLQAFVAAPEARRNELLYAFDSLEKIPENKSPTFTFAHLSCPHDPYVFDKNGKLPKQSLLAKSADDKDSALEMRGRYLDQLTYLNKRIGEVIDNILAKSDVEPIIIIQADHGPPEELAVLGSGKGIEEKRWSARHAILNVYYLPDGGDKLLYPTISPVNSFRVIFNRYFGADYKLLEDKATPDKALPSQASTDD